MTDRNELVARLRASRAVWEDGKARPTYDELAAAARIEADAATIARLEGERDDFADQVANLLPAVNREAVQQRQRAEAAEAKLARAVEGLRWYEQQATDCRKITREGDTARQALDKDGGNRARAIIAEIEGGA